MSGSLLSYSLFHERLLASEELHGQLVVRRLKKCLQLTPHEGRLRLADHRVQLLFRRAVKRIPFRLFLQNSSKSFFKQQNEYSVIFLKHENISFNKSYILFDNKFSDAYCFSMRLLYQLKVGQPFLFVMDNLSLNCEISEPKLLYVYPHLNLYCWRESLN